MYSKPVANIKINGKKLEAIILISGTIQGCSLSPYLFNAIQYSIKSPNRAITQQKKVKGIQIGQEKNQECRHT